MGKLVRCLTTDGTVVALALDATDIVARAEQIHKTSAVVTAALGRLLTAASLMGFQLKGRDDTLTLRLKGDGPAGALLAVGNSRGDVKGYVQNPVVELPLNQYGKLDVAGAVGTSGFLSVSKDLGMKEPYIGQTPIVSGEIAEDITHYYAVSEQVPTVCALGVLVNPDLTVQKAGGILCQLLPFADSASVDTLEANIRELPPVTTMLRDGMTPEDMCRRVLSGFDVEVLDQFDAAYRCDCSRERVERALATLNRDDLMSLGDEQGNAEVTCHFCDKVYRISGEDIERIARTQQK